MNKLRDCAIVLGLAGMILMVSADTKDVEATGKISYESEIALEQGLVTAGGSRSPGSSGSPGGGSRGSGSSGKRGDS